MWTAIKELIHQHNRFVLTSHVNPDGDSLGSELSLAALLRSLGKEVYIFNVHSTPDHYLFLDPAGEIRTFDPQRDTPIVEQAEVIFVLDASAGWRRLGRVLAPVLERSRAKVGCIDHHPDPSDFADVAVVRPGASATAELIYSLYLDMGMEITLPVAEALYVAIMTDTDSFHNPATGPQAHYVAAELLKLGIVPSKLYAQVYEQYPPGRLLAQGEMLSRLQLEYGGRLAWYWLEQEQMRRYNISYEDLEHFPSVGLTIKGSKVSLFLVEFAEGITKISLRSRNGISVNEFAQRFGGGGHNTAAGATIHQPLRQAAAEIVAALAPLLGEAA